MGALTVSAGEAARRLGVAPATVQRWVDSGVLNAERTPGGHRRIYVTELRRLIAANRPAQPSGPIADWLDILMSGDASKVRAALIAAHARTGNWAAVADEVASAIAELGRRWEEGTCQVFQEHAASEALRRAAASCVVDMPCAADAPHAALFTAREGRHTLGLSLAELVLAEAGWRVSFIGEGPPPEELEALIARLRPNLLVVSACQAIRPAAVARYQADLMQAADRAGTHVSLAGSGAWVPAQNAERVMSFADLRAQLSKQVP